MTEKRFPPGKILSSTSKKDWLNLSPLSGQTTIYPRTINFKDIDESVFNWFNGREIIIDGEIVPSFFLQPEKWAEFKKQWKYMDANRVVNYPYVTVRRTNFNPAKSPEKGRIPGRKFTTYKLPVQTPAGPTVKHYKVPQPVKIDFDYEVRVLTHYISEINTINETLVKHFASLQAYLDIDKHYMQMRIESVSDETDVDNLEDENIKHTLYSIQVRGYIIDEDEFEEKLGVSSIIVNIDEDTN